jgi:hypothetical protein
MIRSALVFGILLASAAAHADVTLKDAHVRADADVVLIVKGAGGDQATVDSELKGGPSTFRLGSAGELDLGLPAAGVFHIQIQPKFLKTRSVFLVCSTSGDGFDLNVFDASDAAPGNIDPALISKFWDGLKMDSLRESLGRVGPTWLAAHPKSALLKGGSWILCTVPSTKLECIFAPPNADSDAVSLTNAILGDLCNTMDGLNDADKKSLLAYFSAGTVFPMSKNGLDQLVSAAASLQTILVDTDQFSVAAGPLGSGTGRKFKLGWTIVKK